MCHCLLLAGEVQAVYRWAVMARITAAKIAHGMQEARYGIGL
jgi:hypothetical protein